MNIYLLDSFDGNNDEKLADEFAMDLERKAAELEITVDYYMMEFI